MLVYCDKITPRLQYVVGFFAVELSRDEWKLTTDADHFRTYKESKINYSGSRFSNDEFLIVPHSLLFETGYTIQSIACFEVNGHKAFFRTAGDHPFDIFAATFYLISRYEEWLPHQKDIYGRYAHQNSLAFKENFLDIPLVNYWMENFREKLLQKFNYAKSEWKERKFRFLPTYDIDEAFSYKYKAGWRTAGALVKAFLKGDWRRITERLKVLRGTKQDPYDAFDWMDGLHLKFGLHPVYFFLVAAKTARFDRNILPGKRDMQGLIRRHSKYEVGIHPSWQSGDDPGLFRKELEILERLIDKKITASRQHFIRMVLPETYRNLVDAGIKSDFSMGYGSINGFRASVATAFYWYDLQNEKTTDLLLYPFCFMDANSFFEQKYSAIQVSQELNHYYKKVMEINGLLITLWHNTFLGNDPLFEGWRSVYEKFVENVCGENRG